MPFDVALAEFQEVVARLEAGGLPLEASIALYERGVALHDHCARLLADAELRVQRLVEAAGRRGAPAHRPRSRRQRVESGGATGPRRRASPVRTPA